MKVDKNISEDEAALYDRQIRLWGVDAQKKWNLILNTRKIPYLWNFSTIYKTYIYIYIYNNLLFIIYRLINSKILIINMKGLGAEIAKNLVLSGMNSLTLLDSNDVKSL